MAALNPGGRHRDLRPTMTSDHAFSLIALRCLESMVAHQDATVRGESAALHQMRISVTCLKAAVSFFSPVVAGDQWRRIKLEFKWLNSHLGAARDLDVVVGQLLAGGNAHSLTPELKQQWSASHARVAASLRSDRYRRLIAAAADWIQHGEWRSADTAASKPARAATIEAYASQRLGRWLAQILRQSSKLGIMDADTRHRLRIKTKRVRYAMEWFGEFLPGSTPQTLRAILKQLRRAQGCLGELNDAERARALLEPGKRRATLPKRDRRLVKTTQLAFEALIELTQG
ncbi:MAG: CHAD domain-containing protein [Xanthobacteraceae bacterium]|nr:CHAD domain-containing protein [Xanthobacteraceae bacterium]